MVQYHTCLQNRKIKLENLVSEFPQLSIKKGPSTIVFFHLHLNHANLPIGFLNSHEYIICSDMAYFRQSTFWAILLYFEDTVNQYNYLEMLKKKFWTKVLRTTKYTIFSKMVLIFIQLGKYKFGLETKKFHEKFIYKDFWHSRSPDLNPCGFYLSGSSKLDVL